MANSVSGPLPAEKAHPHQSIGTQTLLYLAVILPLPVLFIFAHSSAGGNHGHHEWIYYSVSTVSVLLTWLFVRWDKVKKWGSFSSKLVAVVGFPVVLSLSTLALCGVIEDKDTIQQFHLLNVYNAYLIGRICFLAGVTALIVMRMPDQLMNDRNYVEKFHEEALHLVRPCWTMFAAIFISDPFLIQQIIAAKESPQHAVIPLVLLNFSGGISLLILPAWNLHDLRERLTTLSPNGPK